MRTKTEYKNGQPYWLACTCCGKEVKNTPKDNVCYFDRPYPQDRGFGQCIECFGDKNATDFKKRIGWAMQTFCEARFNVIRKNLKTENQVKWDKSSYIKKCLIIQKFVEKGYII